MSEASRDSAADGCCIAALRVLAIDAIEQAKSGHPGLPLGAAPMAYVLWRYQLRQLGSAPNWPDRDRFVLSAGHGSMLLYGLLHLSGYDLSCASLARFRQLGSPTPGHPERGQTAGVDVTTGPLGQGAANSVGLAIAERAQAHRFNRPGLQLIDHYTYALLSDGDVMEGISAESASLAGHLGLGRLIWLYDANQVSLDGPTELSFGEDVAARFFAYGWHVQQVADGDTDVAALRTALAAARAEGARPSLIVVHTTIGYGAPNKQGSSAAHGSPLGAEEAQRARAQLGAADWPPFDVPKAAYAHMQAGTDANRVAYAAWQERFVAYRAAHPTAAQAFLAATAGQLAAELPGALQLPAQAAPMATREASARVLQAVAQCVPELIAADADLSVSTLAHIAGGGDFDGRTGAGRNLRCGVREHAMGGIANGLLAHGGVRALTSTFFAFSDYMRPAVRLAALSGLPVLYIWTHDSIGLGEDGPTHQPIEQLMSLRAMPNLWLLRPADQAETVAAWQSALERADGPTALVLTRQKLPALPVPYFGTPAAGGYVVANGAAKVPDAVLLATGSEVHLALAAQKQAAAQGRSLRVVSLPCWEAFSAQSAAYRAQVLPPGPPRLSLEAGVTLGWCRWVGDRGDSLGLDSFGASAPAAALAQHFGFTPKHVLSRIEALLKA